MIKRELIESFRNVVYNFKFVLLFFATNFFIALTLSIQVFQTLWENLSKSLISEQMATNSDFLWYLQFRNLYSTQLDKLPTAIIVAAILYIMIQTFFSGGLLTIFNNTKKNHIIDFFYGGVKYWLRFIKVTIIALILIGIAFVINDLLGDLITWAYSKTDYVLGDFILRSARYTILIFLIGTVVIISDYAKVDILFRDENSIWESLKRVVVFLKNNFLVVFLVFFVLSLISIGIAILYNIVGNYISRTPYVYIIITFTVQQILIIFRFGIKMLFASTELNLYKALIIEPIRVRFNEETKME